jgi:hypothetical protein
MWVECALCEERMEWCVTRDSRQVRFASPSIERMRLQERSRLRRLHSGERPAMLVMKFDERLSSVIVDTCSSASIY